MIESPVKVSLIVPIYNVEKYISCCLNSCINQTLYDIEIICVNDGSTDNSLSMLQEFAKIDNRVKIVNKENGGLSSARNAGIKVACGSIIMFLDSDDYLQLNACERVWCEFLEKPTDIVIFGTNIFPINPEPSQWHRNVLWINTKRFYSFTPKVLFKTNGSTPFVWRQAFSRQLISTNDVLFDEDVKYGEDTVFQLKIFPHARNFSFISDQLYNYRWYREGSLMSSLRDEIDNRISNHLEFVENITEYWKQQGWLDSYGSEYLQWLLTFLVPDIKEKEVKKADEHFEKLNNLLVKYDLKKHFRNINALARTFARMLPAYVRKYK